MALLPSILFFLSLTVILAAEQTLFEDFENGGFEAWRMTGNAFEASASSTQGGNQPGEVTGFAGESFASSFTQGSKGMGSLTSSIFTIQKSYISFLIGGGNLKGLTSIQLLVDQKIVREAIGQSDCNMLPKTWDVSALKQASGGVSVATRASNCTHPANGLSDKSYDDSSGRCGRRAPRRVRQ